MTERPFTIDDKISQILSFIETAEKLIYQEKMLDLGALEPHMAELVEMLASCPKPEAQHYLERLNLLSQAIERLEKDIDLQHDALTERLRFREGRVNPLMAQEVEDDDQ